MKLTIDDIKRANLCGYLKEKSWDYEDLALTPFQIGIRETFKWQYKRSNPIDLETFMIFISRVNNRANLEPEKRVHLEQAFRKFIGSIYYRNLTHVFMNYESEIKINKSDVLRHRIPLFINSPKLPYFIYYFNKREDTKFFLSRYEVMHNAVWSYHYLNRIPKFTYFWIEDNEIRRDSIKVDEKYISKAKDILLKLGTTTKSFTIPSVQICKNCSKIEGCERYLPTKDK